MYSLGYSKTYYSLIFKILLVKLNSFLYLYASTKNH